MILPVAGSTKALRLTSRFIRTNSPSAFKEEVEQAKFSVSQDKISEKIELSESISRDIPKINKPSSSTQPDFKRPLKIGGLSGFASQVSAKKQKVSTLEKSKLDWQNFKQEEGIEEDLKSFNQGKQGYLEKKFFLERTDLKQFEIEKSLRAGRKKEH